uniref:Uncharacterized protein n=1 Tax=Panagrolaimus davidi TaxID=227884 RepID=A0A914Q0U3_9BILA
MIIVANGISQRKRKHFVDPEIDRKRMKSRTSFEHSDTEQSASPVDDRNQVISNLQTVGYGDVKEGIDLIRMNDMSRKSSPVVFLIDYPLATTTPFDAGEIQNSFAPIKYSCPSEHFIKKCCQKLGLQFCRKKYLELLYKIEFDTINSSSKPATFLETNDQSGFENEESIIEVISSPILTCKHFEAICQWFECRILVYCNEVWKQHGQWNSEGANDIPVLVLEMKECEFQTTIYDIILSLHN